MSEAAVVPTPAAGPTHTPAVTRPSAKLGTLLAVVAFLSSGLVSLGLAAKRFEVWKTDWVVPYRYAHDSFLIHCWVKTLADTGWWLTTDRCGAPFGHEMYDFPTNPNLHFAAMKVLTVFTDEPGTLMNVYFLLGFPLAGWFAHLALRSLRVSHWACFLGAVVYAHQPYHYFRSIDHLFLGTYFMLPLAVMVMVWVFRGEPLVFARNAAGRIRPVFNWRTVVALLVLTLEGFDFPYYPIFAGFFLLITGLAGAAVHGDRVVAWRTVPMLALMVVAFGVNMYPNLIYFAKNGTTPAEDHVTKRPWSDGEVYGLLPVQMFLPAANHPIKSFDHLQAKYYAGTMLPSEGGSQALGSIGVVGFVFLLVGLCTQFRSNKPRGQLLFLLGLLLVAGILFSTAGGFGTFFNLLSITIARTYVRISIFLAFFCVGGFCLVLDAVFARVMDRWRWGWIPVGGVTLLLTALAYKDQTGKSYIETYPQIKEEFRNDREFVERVEAVLPKEGAVFQLPYIAYGSYTNALGKMEPHAHFAPYVHARTSRWSFGAMYGRPGEQEMAKFGRLPPGELLPMLVAYRYSGVYVDRFGYGDGGAEVEKQLRELTKEEPLESGNRRYAYYPLAGYETRLKGATPDARWEAWKDEAREFAHNSPAALWGKGFYPEEANPTPGWERFRWADTDAKLVLTNQSDETRKIRIRFDVSSFHAGTWTLRVDGLGRSESLAVAQKPIAFDKTFDLPPGTHALQFKCDAMPYQTPTSPSRQIVYRVNLAGVELDAPKPLKP